MAKIFIIDNFASGQRLDQRWTFTCSEIESWGHDVIMINGYRGKNYNQNSFLNAAALNKNLSHFLSSGQVTDGSIFIFPNARDASVILLNEYCFVNNIDVTLIGFWTDGVYFREGDIRSKIIGTNFMWSKKFERALIECYDYNLINSHSNLDRFTRYYKHRDKFKIQKCALPFSHGRMLIDTYCSNEGHIKEDLIVMNTSPSMPHHSQIFKMLEKDFSEYRFINFYEHDFSPTEYYRLLAKAKVLISTNIADTNPYSVYEAMMLGCLPVLPDIDVYKEMFKAEWLYDNGCLKLPYINFMRKGEDFRQKVRFFMENYLNYDIRDEVQNVHDEYFNSTELKNIICSII